MAGKAQRTVTKWKISRLEEYPRQAEMSGGVVREELEALAEHVGRHGRRDAAEVTTAGVIIAGHQRVRAAKRLGWKEIDVAIRRGLEAEGPGADSSRTTQCGAGSSRQRGRGASGGPPSVAPADEFPTGRRPGPRPRTWPVARSTHAVYLKSGFWFLRRHGSPEGPLKTAPDLIRPRPVGGCRFPPALAAHVGPPPASASRNWRRTPCPDPLGESRLLLRGGAAACAGARRGRPGRRCRRRCSAPPMS